MHIIIAGRTKKEKKKEKKDCSLTTESPTEDPTQTWRVERLELAEKGRARREATSPHRLRFT